TDISRHMLNPPPALVTATVYRPFDKNCVWMFVVCGDRKRLNANTGGEGGAVVVSAGLASDKIASRGTRSCSSNSVAWTRGSAWKRDTKTSCSTTLVRATSNMP